MVFALHQLDKKKNKLNNNKKNNNLNLKKKKMFRFCNFHCNFNC